MGVEFMKLQKQAVLESSEVDFRTDCNFRVEIDGQPPNLKLFVKDIAYGKGTITSNSIEVGSAEFNRPSKKNAGSLTFTFFDNAKGEISDFVKTLQGRIFDKNGLLNLPVDYLFNVRAYRILEDTSEVLEFESTVYCEENNDYKLSVEAVTERATFNATFKKYCSVGGLLK
ncbi:hypothetical protein [Vibrio europaeus]|uniref:hypothetical protein n=1 Tax=Vibrio europaeus TaxID=300876 RepID=UPI00233EDBD2|nr:hypothetical protein [Vibrio europaeus]MDC5753622.1 hypothetical protein [Vibrio europaeus]MDC5816571.1 hypothetical protein [Vibrio europaeus]